MTVAVLIPFASDDPYRKRLLDWTVNRYLDCGWSVQLGTCEPPWRKGLAVWDAFTRTDHDTVVVADGDTWSDRIAAAVELVEYGQATWVMPGSQLWRFTRQATERILGGEAPNRSLGKQRSHRFVMGGHVMVLSRSWYEAVPIDPRFVDWGGEDLAWGWALATLLGPPKRLPGYVWHLWHEPQSNEYDARPINNVLAGAYRQAIADVDAMHALIEQAYQALP